MGEEVEQAPAVPETLEAGVDTTASEPEDGAFEEALLRVVNLRQDWPLWIEANQRQVRQFYSKEVMLDIHTHAVAAISDAQTGVLTPGDSGVEIVGVGVHANVGGTHLQPTPGGHGVTGVQRQVQEDLLHLAAVDAGQAKRGVKVSVQSHIFSDHPLQHVLHLGDHRV